MLFVELRFAVVFAIAFCVYWSLRSNRHRKLWLLVISYVVYGAFDLRYLALILTSTILDWFAGRGAAEGQPHRKGWLLTSLVGNLGLLGIFKYYNFFVGSASDFLRLIGLPVSDYTLDIILPVGISFYTFQTLSYSIDIYRGRLQPTDRFTDLALFVAFFPQLVAGPIVRAKQFLPQLVDKRSFSQAVDVRFALAIFFFGFVKKTCVSDRLAPIIDSVFSNPGAYDSQSVWLGTFLFSVQVYCDFSGYSDMAIGLAGLLGYKLPVNFLFPYFARTFTNFWQRWHITLGAWFMDYLYVPLGGNRRGMNRTLRNLMLVFLISGLWHGAAWTFVIFGLTHGVLCTVERAGVRNLLERLPLVVAFPWVTLMWVQSMAIFRADDLSVCAHLFGRMYGFLANDGLLESLSWWWWAAVAAWYLIHWVMYRGRVLHRVSEAPAWLFAILFGVAWALALPWVAEEYTPFIYFRF